MDYYYFFEHEVNVQKLKWRGSQGIGLCPLPTHDERNPSFSCCGETGQWYCHGCGQKGNAVTLAKLLHFDDPMKYVSGDSNNHTNGRIGGIKPLKTENRHTSQVNNMEKRDDAKKQVTGDLNAIKKKQDEYTNMIPSELKKALKESDWKLVGHDGEGLTFHYPNAIKLHKRPPWWDSDSIDKSCQIFRKEVVLNWDKESKEYLFICEGEKDALFSPCPDQTITFSAGAGKLPNDISNLKPVQNIMLVPDHDDAGYKGKEREAERIKKEFPNLKIFIAQWHESLPKGYDIWDDWKNSQRVTDYDFDEFYNAVVNATEYTIPIPKQLGEFILMTGKEMDNSEPKPLVWCVEGILPKDFNNFLAGTTGSKKSMWAMQLGLSLANGEKDFYGNKIPKAMKVLYVNTEAGHDEFLRRYKRITANMNWNGQANFQMMSKGGRMVDIWENVHKAIQLTRPEVIIIDCLYNSTVVDDFSRSNNMSKVINELSDFKEVYGITPLVLHHFTKGNHDTLNIDRMAGASALQNWVEFCMVMVKTNRTNFHLWKLVKARGVADDPTVYGLKWNDYWFTNSGIVDDIKPFMIDKEVKLKYADILEGLPERFDTKDWLNVFNQKYPTYCERTGREWLKNAKESKMLKKLAHGLFQKHLRIIDEKNINEV